MVIDVIREVRFWARSRVIRQSVEQARPYLPIDFFGSKIGFFAHLNSFLYALRFAEEQNLVPQIRLVSKNYSDVQTGDDWFDYYFERIISREVPEGSVKRIRVDDAALIGFAFEDDLSLVCAQQLFYRHVRIKAEILSAVDDFCAKYGLSHGSLGVHFRGTDKALEADRPSYFAAAEAVREVMQKDPGVSRIFVASDEQGFIDFASEEFGREAVCSLPDVFRSDGVAPLHIGLRPGGGYALGLDALMNSLVLARCGTIVRTTSFLSAWSCIFNPSAQVRLLNVPHDRKLWFPERVIMQTAKLP